MESQTQSGLPASPSAGQLAGGLPDIPDCPDDLVGVLANGVHVRFDGASQLDPHVCVQRWLDRTHHYYLGFWGHGRYRAGSDEQRQAVARILTAPVGSRETFLLGNHTPGTLFRVAVLEHSANARLQVDGHFRRTVEISVMLADTFPHPRVTSEVVYWLDRETGIPLRKNVITRTEDGARWDTTIWQVTRIEGLPTARDSPDT